MVINILEWPDWIVDRGEETLHDAHFWAHYRHPPTVSQCCGVEGAKLTKHGKEPERSVADVPIRGRRVRIFFSAQRWKCGECGRTFVEEYPEIVRGGQMTKRLATYIRAKSIGGSFVSVASDCGVDEATVRGLFWEEIDKLESEREVVPPVVLGVDEVHLGGARFVMTNLGGEKTALIDMLPSREREVVADYLRGSGWRGQVEVVAMDMWRPYRAAVRKAFGKSAMIVVDRFHVTKLAGPALDRYRREVVASLNWSDRKELRGSRDVFRARWNKLGKDGRETLERWRALYPQLAEAYDVKEAFHAIYDAADRSEASERIEAWRASVPAHLTDVFRTILQALNNWDEEILAFFDCRVTNAGTERTNRFIRQIRSLGNDRYDFRTIRAKVLYASPQLRTGRRLSLEGSRAIPHGIGYVMPSYEGGDLLGTSVDDLLEEIDAGRCSWAIEASRLRTTV